MLPLNGTKVLDLTRLLPGGFATMILADLGCDVIKVEDPSQGDPLRTTEPKINGVGAIHLLINRGKKSLTLNLKREEGRKIFYELVKQTEIVVEGFRPGVAKRLGVDYQTLEQINQKIVYCSITGFGQHGPYRDLAAHDLNYVAMSGIFDFEMQSGKEPAIPPVQIADLSGGSMAVIGILSALLAARKSGRGDYVDIAMLDTAIMWNIYSFAGDPGILRGKIARYNLYKTKDGKYIALGALEDVFWDGFCRAIGIPDLAASNLLTEDQKKSEIQEEIGKRDFKELQAITRGVDTCLTDVMSKNDVRLNPHVLHRKIFRSLVDPRTGEFNAIRTAVDFKSSDIRITSLAPSLGENTEAILSNLGCKESDIASLKENGIV